MEKIKRWAFDALIFLVEVVEDFLDDDCDQYAAAVAYYTVLSLPAALILVVSIGGIFLDAQVVASAIEQRAHSMLAPSATQQLVGMIDRAGNWASTGPWWAVVLSVVGLLFGATRAFAQLQTALNRAWGIRPKPGNVVRRFVLKRLVSFGALGILAALLLVSIALKAIVQHFTEFANTLLPNEVMGVLEWASGHTLSLLFATLFLGSLYWLLPDVKIRWHAVAPGALLTALLFEGLSSLMTFYLGSLKLDDAFGQAGSFAVLLIWLYLCALLLFFGAEFTQVWSKYMGEPVQPEDGAGDEPAPEPQSAVDTVAGFLSRWGYERRERPKAEIAPKAKSRNVS